ncbi:MAG: hypothetical protein GY697_21160 [Desulfobacterales bacterium]|nr:hypothetical protein [Desulfobacterales bacterium]
MAQYLASIAGLVSSDPRIEGFNLLALPALDDRPEIKAAIRTLLPLPQVGRLAVLTGAWDLIVTADNFGGASDALSDIPMLRISHGSVARPEYWLRSVSPQTRFFVSSSVDRDAIIAGNSSLLGAVRVVGSLHDDRLLVADADRLNARTRVGLPGDRPVVYVMSTWGVSSLYRRLGEGLLQACCRLIERFSFVLDIHPNEYRRSNGGIAWGERIQALKQPGIVIRSPQESFIPYLVAADVVVADHTSLAYRAVLLGRPMVYAAFAAQHAQPGSLLERLVAERTTPLLADDASNLEQCLETAVARAADRPYRAYESEINSCRGEFTERATSELYTLLDLAQPTGSCNE